MSDKSKFKKFVPLLIIIVSCIAIYMNSLNGDFVCDDVPMIVETDSFSSIKYLPDYFTKGVWYFSSLVMEDLFLYRPLFLFNFFINYQLWGANPLGFHITNLLLHIGNSLLVYLFIKKSSPDKRNVASIDRINNICCSSCSCRSCELDTWGERFAPYLFVPIVFPVLLEI